MYNESMIKNIIFDLGNVLVTFQPHTFLNDLIHDEKIENQLFEIYFQRGWWHLYDQGLYSTEDMIQKGIDIYPQYESYIRLMMKKWVEYVIPIPQNIQVLMNVKNDFDVYILSNIPKDDHMYLEQNYDFMKEVKGAIYSYQEKLIKPDKKIFTLLCEKYTINPRECLFIDDKEENIQSAMELGFHTIHLTNAFDLETKLKEFIYEV